MNTSLNNDKHSFAEKYLVIANWKMYMTRGAIERFALQFQTAFTGEEWRHILDKIRLALCPSFPYLSYTHALLNNQHDNAVMIGGQDCSAFTEGAHTSQVSARMLSENGCTYCIVGHSEQRKYGAETNDIVAQKALQALDSSLVPIVCIGESKEEFEHNQTEQVLQKQLASLCSALQNHQAYRAGKQITLSIAYEPLWAIGTGLTPEESRLQAIAQWVMSYLEKTISELSISYQLIYGGSVNEKTIPMLLRIAQLRGFLIGSASTEFTSFQKIVSLIAQGART